jgi:hypothetical protein
MLLLSASASLAQAILSPATPTYGTVESSAPHLQPAGHESVLSSLFWGRADVGIFAMGNFNPTTQIYIQNEPHQVLSSNKSSLGGGFEWRRWFANDTAIGVAYAQNPSDGKLLWQGTNYIEAEMRREFSLLVTQRLPLRVGKFAPYLDGGPGFIVTNGYGDSGWSHAFAYVAGGGSEYRLTPRLSVSAGMRFEVAKSGCYGDPTCTEETWGVVKDLTLGFRIQSSSILRRRQ